jgi:CO/xanthine dehydrogenase Mo-binding subunit
LFAFYIPARASDEPAQEADGPTDRFAPNAFIGIDHSGRTTLVMPQVEMGQGVYTSIPMILAEELDADFSQVVLEHAPTNDRLYANPMLGYQVTGNSNSIRSFWGPLRMAGATARAMLIQAAAMQWRVEPASCKARRRHPARFLPSGLSRHRCCDPIRRQDRELEIPHHRFCDLCAPPATGVKEWNRHRCRRQRDRHPL